MWLQMAPAMEWKIASSPMKTTTIDSTEACRKGRRIVRSIVIPMRKDSAAAAISAIQKLKPHWISCQHRYVLNIAISPWAKLMCSVETKIITSASATSA